MSMDAELYSRVRKLEKQVEALMERHPEVRAVLERGTMKMEALAAVSELQELDRRIQESNLSPAEEALRQSGLRRVRSHAP